MAMANSWGLFLVIMFMGYGLVAVPRKLWYAGDIQKHLTELYTKAPRVKEECMDSELEFDELAKVNIKKETLLSTWPLSFFMNRRLMPSLTDLFGRTLLFEGWWTTL